MMKVLFPLIFVLALELMPVVKTYADIKSKYGENLINLTPQLQHVEGSDQNALFSKIQEIEKSLSGTQEAKPSYWF